MSSFSVSQGSSTVQISSDAAGFHKDSANRYYLNYSGLSSASDSFVISFADGASIRLTDFSEINNGASSNSQINVIGIPASPEGSFQSSFNIIGGQGWNGTFDVYDNSSNILLIDDYRPQGNIFIDNIYFEPFAQFGYSSGSLTIQSPYSPNLLASSWIESSGLGTFSSGPASYIGGSGGTPNSQQYTSGGGANPWVFALTGVSSEPICFAKGTLISRSDGSELPIEALAVGDIVATSSGDLPIKWIGRRTLHRRLSTLNQYKNFIPVRIEAGSLGANIPRKDLLVSDCHGICVDGKIVNASFLVNQINIYKDADSNHPFQVDYFHLEFEDEVMVMANGAQACSYVNAGNRRNFDNYMEFISRFINIESTVRSLVYNSDRSVQSAEGKKDRIIRSWQVSESQCA
ncbi:Hint domain-containing protein [Synechococcus sp. LTW-G]